MRLGPMGTLHSHVLETKEALLTKVVRCLSDTHYHYDFDMDSIFRQHSSLVHLKQSIPSFNGVLSNALRVPIPWGPRRMCTSGRNGQPAAVTVIDIEEVANAMTNTVPVLWIL